MIDLEYLNGKSLALILWGNTKEGKSDIQIHFGTTRKEGQAFFFDPASIHSPLLLDDQLVAQIKLPDNSLKQLMKGAQFVLSLSVGTLDEGSDLATLIHPGKSVN